MRWLFSRKPDQPPQDEARTPTTTIASGERSIAINTRGGPFLGNAITGDNPTIVQVPP